MLDRYDIPEEFDSSAFPIPDADSTTPPNTYYPMTLVAGYPTDSDRLCFAEGRLLYLAIRFVEEQIHSCLVQDPQTKLFEDEITSSKLLKVSLTEATPALVSFAFFITLSLFLIFASISTVSGLLQSCLAWCQELPFIRDIVRSDGTNSCSNRAPTRGIRPVYGGVETR